MNKIITILAALILSGCSAQQVKTTDMPDLASTTTAPTRHHTKLQLGRHDGSDEDGSLFPGLTNYLKQGIASWYGPEFHGKKTASGEIYDMYEMTAAHNTLPISSYARVTNLENHRSVIVRINDRGPFHGKRVMDLSYAAAKKLNLHHSGTGAVEIKALAPDQALAAQLKQEAAKPQKSVFLHVGTFGNKKKAQTLQDKIAANHLPKAQILPSKRKGATIYKVQLGPIQSPENVHQLNTQLAKLGIAATVTENDQNPLTMIQ